MSIFMTRKPSTRRAGGGPSPAAVSFLLSAALALAGCGSPEGASPPSASPAPVPSPTPAAVGCPPSEVSFSGRAYVQESRSLSAYAIGATSGCLALRGSLPLPETTSSSLSSRRLAVDPSLHFVYAAAGGEVFAFRIHPTDGGISAIGHFPLPVADSLEPTTMVAATHALFVLLSPTRSGIPHRIVSYLIDDATGALDAPEPLSTLPDPGFLGLDSTRQLLYVEGVHSELHVATIEVLKVSPSGGTYPVHARVVSSLGGLPVGVRYSSVLIDPASSLFLWAKTTENLLATFRLDPDGDLGDFVTVDPGGAEMGVHPSGRFLYQASGNQIAVDTVRRQTSGFLARTATLQTTGPVGALAIDAAGRFLYGSGATGGMVRAFAINNSDGSLREVGPVAGGGALLLIRDPS